MKVTILAGGGGDIYYELGLCSGLVSAGINVNYIGSDSFKDAEIFKNEKVTFYNLRGSQNPNVSLKEKGTRILKYYLRLIKYAAITDSKLFHIQWLNKFIYFDRTFLILYYKMLGKKLVFTAHNVNAGVRDGNDSLANRLTLKIMYKLVNHIIVHTNKMKQQLIEEYGVINNKVTVIPYGINNMVFKSDLTKIEAREKIGLEADKKVILFFGIVTPYKGLEYLLMALANFKKRSNDFKLIIAGKIERNCEKYWEDIKRIIKENELQEYIIEKTEYISDKNIEVYFKAADTLVLPYKYIFQSGVLFLAFNFGLPVIATDVGSLKDFIIEGRTGFVCRPEDPEDLCEKITQYFNSELFKNLEKNKEKIIEWANNEYSWNKIGEKTYSVYKILF